MTDDHLDVHLDVREFRITLTVDDFDAAVRLYRDALGLPEVADWSSDAGRVLLLDAGRATRSTRRGATATPESPRRTACS